MEVKPILHHLLVLLLVKEVLILWNFVKPSTKKRKLGVEFGTCGAEFGEEFSTKFGAEFKNLGVNFGAKLAVNFNA